MQNENLFNLFMFLFYSLKELILDRNGIKDLPHEIAELKNLRNISLAGNCLGSLPPFFNMRALTLTVRRCISWKVIKTFCNSKFTQILL